MLQEPTVMLDNLVLSLSDSLDLIHPSAADHQQRVAYIALRIAKAMGHHPAQQADLMYASVLHDIGLLSVEEKIQSMTMESKDEGRGFSCRPKRSLKWYRNRPERNFPPGSSSVSASSPQKSRSGSISPPPGSTPCFPVWFNGLVWNLISTLWRRSRRSSAGSSIFAAGSHPLTRRASRR